MKNKHNGWTNYATWRVNLELIDNANDYINQSILENPELKDVTELASFLNDYVTDWFETSFDNPTEPQKIFLGYADSFLTDVNYHEIAENILADFN